MDRPFEPASLRRGLLSAALVLSPLACKKEEEKKAEPAAPAKAVAKAAEDAPSPAPAGGAIVGSNESVKDALSKLPAQALFALHVDLKRMSASPIWEQAKKQAEKDPEYGKRMLALAKCGLSLDSLAALAGPATMTAGFAGEDNGAFVLHMPNIGKQDLVSCMIDVVKKENADTQIAIGEYGGKSVLELEDDGIAFLVPDDHLVAGPKASAEAMKAVLFDGAPNASSGDLPGLLANVATDKTVWFAGDVTKMADAPKDGPFVGLTSLVGSIDIDKGLAIRAVMTYAEAAQATKSESELAKAWKQVRPLAAGAGITPQMADKLTFKAQGTAVNVAFELTAAELATIGKSLEAMTAAAAQGPGGMPPGGMPPGAPPPAGQPPAGPPPSP